MFDAFLCFLTHDMASHPERLHAFDNSLVQRTQTLTGSIEIDINAHL